MKKENSNRISGHDKSLMFIHVMWVFAVIVCTTTIFASLAWVFSPTDWKVTVRMEADDNMEGIMNKAIDTQLIPLDNSILRDSRLYEEKGFSESRNGSCIMAGDCFQNSSLVGCQKQDCNWCCKNVCTLLYCEGDRAFLR